MKFQKYISAIIHPIVIPTIGVMIYFLFVPTTYMSAQKFTVLSAVFVITYLIPLFTLLVFKKLKLIDSYKTETIKERRLPVLLMVILFYFLANTLNSTLILKDLTLLFYSSSLGLLIIYILFYFKFKMSIHLFSLGISTGFFLVLSEIYSQSFLLVIIILIFLSGLVASARLHLKAHNKLEVYSGFFVGIIAVFATYFIL